MSAETEYRLADQAMKILRKKSIKRFDDAKTEADLMKFDELNVLSACKTLYKRLDADNRKVFLELAREKHRRTYSDSIKKTKEKKDRGTRIGSEWLSDFLLEYDPITKYVYANEVDRKRERLAESVNATQGAAQKQKEFTKALGYWTQMTSQYLDGVSDRATLVAFEDAGVAKVRWNTQEDGRECKTCADRNGKVYAIDNLPPKPHWGCRCYYTAVLSNKQKFKNGG